MKNLTAFIGLLVFLIASKIAMFSLPLTSTVRSIDFYLNFLIIGNLTIIGIYISNLAYGHYLKETKEAMKEAIREGIREGLRKEEEE